MDVVLLRAINSVHSPALDAAAHVLSTHGFEAFPLILLVVLAVRGRARAAAVRDGLLAWFVGLTLAESVIKPFVGRPRPTTHRALRASLHLIEHTASGSSFPSGTAASCFAGATWIWLRWGPRAGVPAVLLALLVSTSRVYVAAHYPSDILGGALLGIAAAFGVDRFTRWAGSG